MVFDRIWDHENFLDELSQPANADALQTDACIVCRPMGLLISQFESKALPVADNPVKNPSLLPTMTLSSTVM